MTFRYNLGDKVRDTVTTFVGIVVGRTEWYNGCVRYGVQCLDLKDGKPQDECWFDEQRLQLAEAASIPPVVKQNGGPQRDPVQQRGR